MDCLLTFEGSSLLVTLTYNMFQKAVSNGARETGAMVIKLGWHVISILRRLSWLHIMCSWSSVEKGRISS